MENKKIIERLEKVKEWINERMVLHAKKDLNELIDELEREK